MNIIRMGSFLLAQTPLKQKEFLKNRVDFIVFHFDSKEFYL